MKRFEKAPRQVRRKTEGKACFLLERINRETLEKQEGVKNLAKKRTSEEQRIADERRKLEFARRDERKTERIVKNTARARKIRANPTPKQALCIMLLNSKAAELGRSPTKAEMGEQRNLIKSAFGPWSRALEAAGLKKP